MLSTHLYRALAITLLSSFVALPAAFAKEHAPQGGPTFTVLPTGGDDTANLQSAFDDAIAAGPGSTVQLVEGTYNTAQIVVNNFDGRFRGAGADRTIVQNVPDLEVNVVNQITQVPSATVKFPMLFAFTGGSLAISRMTIRVVGDNPTTGWSFFGNPLTELAAAIIVLGPQAGLRVRDVVVEGAETPDSNPAFGQGFNLINGIQCAGFIGGNPGAQALTFAMTRSTVRTVADCVSVFGLDNAAVAITRNTFEDALNGASLADAKNTHYVLLRNEFDTANGMLMVDIGFAPLGLDQSAVLVMHNRFRGTDGITLAATFGLQTFCLLLGNDVDQVTGTDIFLGPGTRNCLVIGSGPGATIVDLGVNNFVFPGG